MNSYEMLCKKHGLCEMLAGKNENDEDVLVTINEHEAYITTLQKNGRLRINVYHKDGVEEEMYRK